MTTFLHSWLGSLFGRWAAVALLLLLWVIGTLWEHKTHRNKQVTGGWLLFLLGVIVLFIFWAQVLGVFRWIIGTVVLVAGLVSIRIFMKRTSR